MSRLQSPQLAIVPDTFIDPESKSNITKAWKRWRDKQFKCKCKVRSTRNSCNCGKVTESAQTLVELKLNNNSNDYESDEEYGNIAYDIKSWCCNAKLMYSKKTKQLLCMFCRIADPKHEIQEDLITINKCANRITDYCQSMKNSKRRKLTEGQWVVINKQNELKVYDTYDEIEEADENVKVKVAID